MEELSKRIAELSPAKRALLELRLKEGSARERLAQTIKPRVNRNSAVVSFAQQRLWFLDQLEENRALYNVPRALRLSGALDIEALQRTLNELVSRHEPFRTYFHSVDGTLRQIISEKAEISLARTDLSNLPPEEREERAKQVIREEAAHPFDLAHGPVIRASLLRLAEQEHILLLTTHHIVSDAWSAGILFRELEELYNAFASGQSSPLAPLAIQYADFAEWQRKWLQGDVLERQLSYWRSKLHGVTGILELPTDRPRSAAQTSRGAYKFLTLSKALSSALAELSKREGATLFMTLLAAFQTLLWRYSDQDDIVVGSPIAGRNRAEIEGLIGFFINTLALRTDLSGNPTFRLLLAQVKETALGAYAHQDLPFEKLVEELQPERDLGRNPLFQVMFQFQNTSGSPLYLKGLSVSKVDASTETAKFDLMMAAREEDGALMCVMEYNTDLFAGETIERMLGHYATLLESIVANPDARVVSLPLTTNAQRRQVLVEWNATQAEFPDGHTIHQLFHEQAARAPHDLAVVFSRERVTYGELNARATQLAQHLRRCGVGPEVRVAICVERSVDMIVGLLGILKAGGAYVPLEPAYPAERISFILADSQARLLLTQQRLRDSLPIGGMETIYLDSEWPEIARESADNPAVAASAENSAHVIYTSGSTGQPKGVVSSHRTSLNRFAWMWRTYPFAAAEVCCQKTALSFVDSIWEIFGPLLQGVPLVIIPDDTVKDPQRFVAALSDNRVTRLVLVPSLLRVILELGGNLARQLSDLRYCVCSGETLPVDLATIFREQIPQATLINLYGSSEVAADVTCYEVRNTDGLATVPIGRPIANIKIYILDSHLQLAPVGVPGEIYVGGEGLARGYLNRAELTAEKFVAHPFSRSSGARLFRTGDIGRYLPDGNIEYRGRRDHQVKVRGFRIELGEIEAHLASHRQVHRAVVIECDDERGDKQLVAYVCAAGETPATNELRAHLRRKLPDYMIPAAFVLLEALPLTASGKVNRLALPRPDRAQLATREDFVAPRTPTEEILAGVWADVLNTEDVGVNDDFFALGGHSLLLAQLAARISESFQLDLPLRDLFEAPTVARISERIEAGKGAAKGFEDVPLISVSRAGALPLSFAQERLWFFDQLEPNSAAYNIPRALRLNGTLDTRALQQSLDTIVARQEVLRTSFLIDQGRPALSIASSGAVEIPLFDLSQLTIAEREEKAKEFAARETGRPFDLARGPLLRLALVKLGDEDHILLLTMHHIISDGWSIGVFLRELVICYNALTTGASPDLPALAVQYVDFAAWQRQRLSRSALQKQLDYWCKQLAGSPAVIDLPFDRPRPPLRSFHGARHSLDISKEITDKLKTLARRERATLFMTLLATFQTLLSCLANQDDVVVGSPTAGRDQPECEALIGYFVNTLVLRAEFSGDPTFRESLRRARETALGAFANQEVPFEKLVEELKPARALQYNPLFQVWFVFQNALVERQELNGLTVESLAIESATTRHDLQLTLWETAKGIEGAFTYSTDLFEAETIACMAEQFQTLLSLVVEQPNIVLSALRSAVNETGRAYRNKTSAGLEEASRQKLKSTKRKVVTGTRASAKEEPWTSPDR
jgi:amino acid adenylation domain-containing protein